MQFTWRLFNEKNKMRSILNKCRKHDPAHVNVIFVYNQIPDDVDAARWSRIPLTFECLKDECEKTFRELFFMAESSWANSPLYSSSSSLSKDGSICSVPDFTCLSMKPSFLRAVWSMVYISVLLIDGYRSSRAWKSFYFLRLRSVMSWCMKR